MKKTKKLLSLLLAAVLFLQPVSYVQASGNVKEVDILTETVINPMYEDIYSKKDFEISSKKRSITYSEGTAYESDPEVIIEQIRNCMLKRENEFTLYYTTENQYEESSFKKEINEMFDSAFAETEDPRAGDYLLWNWGGHEWRSSGYSKAGVSYYNIEVSVKYHTSLAQEEEFDLLLDEAMNTLDLNNGGYSNYQKIEKIYEYICNKVTYDYENLEDKNYLLKHTAYAALKYGTAVCQGYATLLYRMLREVNIPVRVIVGDAENSNGEKGAHAWNAVKLGEKYYLLDSTWDDSLGGKEYFLKGTDVFNIDHFPDEPSVLGDNEISDKAYIDRETPNEPEIPEESEEEKIEYDGITIDGLEISDNAKTLTAGDTVTLTITLKNNKDSKVTLNPNDFYVCWEMFDENGDYNSYDVRGTGDYFEIPAKGMKNLIINYTTSEFTLKGERNLSVIAYFGDEFNEGIRYTYNSYTNTLIGYSDTGSESDEIPYDGEVDWNITTADNVDISAPVIENISILTDYIKAPGNIKIRMILADEGQAKVDVISYNLRDTENNKNSLYGYVRSNDLVQVEGGYEFEIDLPEDIIAATYTLTDIAITDQNGESRYYYANNGKLDDYDGNIFNNIYIIVDESECKDLDFELPIVESMTFPSSIKAGEDLKVNIKVVNEENIEYASLRFTKELGYIDIISKSVKKNADGTFTCVFPVGDYVSSGKYYLDRIRIEDASIRQNYTLFYYDKYDKNLYSPTTKKVYDYSGNTELVITDSGMIVTIEDQLGEVIKNTAERSTITITDSDTNIRVLAAKDLLAAKEKELKLIITYAGCYSEIEIDTKDIPNDYTGKVIAGIGRSSLMKEALYIEEQENPDKRYFPFDILFTEDEIPFTMRVQISDTFRNHDIKLVGYSEEKNKKLIASGLDYDEGFVEYKFENGIASEMDSVQDGQYAYYYGYISCSEEVLENEHIEKTVKENFIASTMSADGSYDMVTYCEECGEELEREFYSINKIASVNLSADTYIYSGNIIKPEVTIKDSVGNVLEEGKDYTLSDEAVNGKSSVGTYSVNVTFIGEYSGSATKTFTINPKSIVGKTAKLSYISSTYSGSYKKPTVTISGLEKDTHYTVSYKNNYYAGKATVTIKGKGNYTGTITKTFTITPKSIAGKTAKLSYINSTYSGSYKKPTVTISGLKKDTHYTVSYKNNYYVGKATVTIKGKGNYTGTITKTFKINPKKTSITSIKKGTKSFTVKWNKISSQVTGYQIRYSKYSSMSGAKTTTVSSYKTISKTVKSLSAKKKYYVQVRTYKKTSSGIYYSDWSSKKYVTTK